MAIPAFLRYIPARLKPLSAPAVWAPLTVFTLLSIFIWEYHNNPDWFNRPQVSNLNPDSELTPEEQARLSEIDTLDLLLRGALQTDGEGGSTGINPEASGATDPGPSGLASDRNLAGRDNPFAAYEAQYQFPGSDSARGSALNAGSNSDTSSAVTASPLIKGSPSSLGASDAETVSPNVNSSVLSEALNRQQSVSNNNDGGSVTSTGNDGAFSGVQSSEFSSQGSASEAGRNGGSSPSPISAASGNVAVPFIRTTPEMSPPAGTTGYQVPNSANLPVFNVPPQQPTRNPLSPSVRTPLNRSAVPAATVETTPPTANYTAPSFTQPEQNSRRR
ncbi:MAG: hypothetical protein AAF703_08030 [Cyanobacteria bacterium P01_D01_bin.105]